MKLIVTAPPELSQAQPESSFDQDVVTIGSKEADEAHFHLPEEELAIEHVRLEKRGAEWVIYNLNEDPSVTLNGDAFGETVIDNGGVLQIKEYTLRFEAEVSDDQASDEIDLEAEIQKLSEFFDPTEVGEEAVSDAEVESLDVDALFDEVEKLDENSGLGQAIGKQEEEEAQRLRELTKPPETEEIEEIEFADQEIEAQAEEKLSEDFEDAGTKLQPLQTAKELVDLEEDSGFSDSSSMEDNEEYDDGSDSLGLFEEEDESSVELLTEEEEAQLTEEKENARETMWTLGTIAACTAFFIGGSLFFYIISSMFSSSAPVMTPEALAVLQNAQDEDERGHSASVDDYPLIADRIELVEHPLFKELQELKRLREASLKKKTLEIVTLLNTNTRGGFAGFEERRQQLIDDYDSLNLEELDRMSVNLRGLYGKYRGDVSSEGEEIFFALVRGMSLEGFLPEDLGVEEEEVAESNEDENAVEHALMAIIDDISEANDLEELDALVSRASEWLSPEWIADPDVLVQQQNYLRTEVLRKVGAFLLSPSQEMLSSGLEEGQRATLNHILDTAKVSELEEREFYLQEFDLLMSRIKQSTGKGALSDLKEKKKF